MKEIKIGISIGGEEVNVNIDVVEKGCRKRGKEKRVLAAIEISSKMTDLLKSVSIYEIMKKEAGYVPAYEVDARVLETSEGVKFCNLKDYHFGMVLPTEYGKKEFDGILSIERLHGNVYVIVSDTELKEDGKAALEELLARLFIEKLIDTYVIGEEKVERKRKRNRRRIRRRRNK